MGDIIVKKCPICPNDAAIVTHSAMYETVTEAGCSDPHCLLWVNDNSFSLEIWNAFPRRDEDACSAMEPIRRELKYWKQKCKELELASQGCNPHQFIGLPPMCSRCGEYDHQEIELSSLRDEVRHLRKEQADAVAVLEKYECGRCGDSKDSVWNAQTKENLTRKEVYSVWLNRVRELMAEDPPSDLPAVIEYLLMWIEAHTKDHHAGIV